MNKTNNPLNIEDKHLNAATEAQKQWNRTACGELQGDKTTCEYFDRVDADRFSNQAWTLDFFKYDQSHQKKILEIGVGQGVDLVRFANGGAECFGLDITDNHLQLTLQNFLARKKQPPELTKSDACNMPFSNDFFDEVYSFGVVHHIPDISRVLQECRRVLKPAGTIKLAVYSKWSAFHVCRKILHDGLLHGQLFKLGYAGLLATIELGADGINIKPYVKLYTPEELSDILKHAGFSVKKIEIHQFEDSHFWPGKIWRLIKKNKTIRNFVEAKLGWYVAVIAQKT